MQHYMYQSFLMLSSYYKVTQKDFVFIKSGWMHSYIFLSCWNRLFFVFLRSLLRIGACWLFGGN